MIPNVTIDMLYLTYTILSLYCYSGIIIKILVMLSSVLPDSKSLFDLERETTESMCVRNSIDDMRRKKSVLNKIRGHHNYIKCQTLSS